MASGEVGADAAGVSGEEDEPLEAVDAADGEAPDQLRAASAAPSNSISTRSPSPTRVTTRRSNHMENTNA